MKVLIILENLDKLSEPYNYAYGKVLDVINHVEETTIICLREGESNIPHNVQVFDLDKTHFNSRIQKILFFLKTIFKLRSTYDVVLVYRAYEFVVLGGFFWKLMGKRVVLWYNHKHCNMLLRIATMFSDKVVSPLAGGFPIATSKFKVVQGGSFLDSLS